MLFAAFSASAEALPGQGIPDALYLDIITAPGYLWMNGCGEIGANKTQPVTLDLDLDLSIGIEVPTPVPVLATPEAHAGHHPGQGAPALSDVVKFPNEIERELTELSLALAGISNSLYWGK